MRKNKMIYYWDTGGSLYDKSDYIKSNAKTSFSQNFSVLNAQKGKNIPLHAHKLSWLGMLKTLIASLLRG